MPKTMQEGAEVKILTPVGMLGYGFPQADLERGMEREPDAIILDSGSTDPGPYMLGCDQLIVKPAGYVRDLRAILSAIGQKKIPLIIGSAGGSGSAFGVDFVAKTVSDLCHELGLSKKIVAISADIDPATVSEALAEGCIEPCSSAPELTQRDIDASVRVVAQMGAEPIVAALEAEPDVDVLVCGRAYDPSPYAAYCIWRGIKDPGIYWHMGKIMECGAFCCEKKGQVILATVRQDSFDLEPMDPQNRCTTLTVAAHTLYEKTRPDLLPGPGGVLDLNGAHYEQLTERSVRVGGSCFHPSEHYQVKLEGAERLGFRTSFIGGVRDPVLIRLLSKGFLKMVVDYAKSMHPELASGEAQVFFHLYGIDAVMEAAEPEREDLPHEVGVLCEVVAPTQEAASAICATVRVAVLHGPYPGQLATGGNLALPLNPPEQQLGPVCRFSIYHLMQVDDPVALFPYKVMEV